MRNLLDLVFPKLYNYLQKKRERKMIRDSKRLSKLLKETEIRNYFQGLNRETEDYEIQEIIDFLQNHSFSVIPYSFVDKYKALNIKVYYDKDCKMQYIEHDQKKLFFPQGWSKKTIQHCYNALCIEQDLDSPHRYQTPNFTVAEGDIIADVGAAEGMWVLNNVEKAAKVYLFECNQKWLQALQKTFEPWKEKVTIVTKYVSSITDENNVTLDTFFGNDKIDFIKADIEGMEVKMLEGSKHILSTNSNIKLLLCAYHKKNDGQVISELLNQYGFTTEYSKRYMLFISDKDIEKPYIRRGLVRARKVVK